MNTTNKTLGLTGLIFQSPHPDRLARFYKEIMGIPLELNTHGGLYEHWECDFNHIHFAILKAEEVFDGNLVVPSFAVHDIEEFVTAHRLTLEEDILPLGGGSFVGRIKDPDGNRVHLWMHKRITA